MNIESPYNTFRQQTEQQVERISTTIETIISGLGAEEALRSVQASWGEGEIKNIDYFNSGLPDSQSLNPVGLDSMRVGMRLTTNVPVVIGHYQRQYLGEGYYKPVECRPGHSHSSGRYSKYGKSWALTEGEVRDEATSMEVYVSPFWDEDGKYGEEGELLTPKKYLLELGNSLLPNTRKALSVVEMQEIDYKKDEMVNLWVQDFNVTSMTIRFGIKENSRFLNLDTSRRVLSNRFNEMFKKAVDQRNKAGGIPAEFRERNLRLAENLPIALEEGKHSFLIQDKKWIEKTLR